MPENSQNQDISGKQTDFNSPNSSVGESQATTIPTELKIADTTQPTIKKKRKPSIPQQFIFDVGGKTLKMIRKGNRKLTDRQMKFIEILNTEGSSGDSMKALLIKAGYTEKRANQGIAAAGDKVKVLIEDLIDEAELFEKHKKLENRIKVEQHTFPISMPDENIRKIFEGYGTVQVIHRIPYNPVRINPITGEIECYEKKVWIQTTDNITVAGAMDRSFKIKGKYIQKTENKNINLSLTEVLKEMAELRGIKEPENV